MKKLILAVFMLATICANAQTQNYSKVGNTYKVEKATSQSAERKTDFIWEDSKGNQYPIYMGKTGACFVKRISQKTGKEYKQYLGKEISQDICNQLNVTYKSK